MIYKRYSTQAMTELAYCEYKRTSIIHDIHCICILYTVQCTLHNVHYCTSLFVDQAFVSFSSLMYLYIALLSRVLLHFHGNGSLVFQVLPSLSSSPITFAASSSSSLERYSRDSVILDQRYVI